VSFAVALVMQFGFPEMPPWKKMMITIGITTASWLAVTLLTKPTDSAVAEKFKSTVRAEGRDVGKGLLLTTLSAMVIFTMIWAVGKVLFR
jgi:hypothetical protein